MIIIHDLESHNLKKIQNFNVMHKRMGIFNICEITTSYKVKKITNHH